MNAKRWGANSTLITCLKFAGLQFLFWAGMSVGNYQVVYLQAQGCSAATVGMVNAATNAAVILATPLWGMISDRIRSIRKIYMITVLGGGLLYMFLPLVLGATVNAIPLLLLYIASVYVFRSPASTMLDNWLVRYSAEKHLNYGAIRCNGSIGWTIVGILISGLVASKGTAWTFPACALCMLPSFILAWFTEDSSPAPRNKKESFDPRQMFKNYYFVTFLPFAFLSAMVLNCICVFLPYLMESVGVAGTRYGLISSYTAFLELPSLLLLAPLRKRFPLYKLSIACGCCFMAAGLLQGFFGRTFWTIMFFQTFTGLGNGLMIASCANYVYSLTPDHLKATAQSIYTAANSTGVIVGGLICGVLSDTIGVRPTYIVLGAIGAFSAVYLTATIMLGKKLVPVHGQNE